MARIVFITPDLSRKLDRMADAYEEANGILIYKRRGDICPVDALFVTAAGSPDHVRASEQRMEIANEFFRRNPGYDLVKFHTHSRETIRRYGEYYASNFSNGDIESYQEQMRVDRDFIGMLVTPKVKLLYGIDHPVLQVARDISGYRERKKLIEDEIERIEIDLGYAYEKC